MVDYNNTKRMAFTMIENLIRDAGKKGISKKVLIYQITLKFGISKKLIEERLKDMTELSIIDEVEGILSWKRKT